MVAKGKDASDLFPAVVKNVVAKNIEVSTVILLSTQKLNFFARFSIKFQRHLTVLLSSLK